MLLHIKFRTPLLHLALIMHLLPLALPSAITSRSSSDLSKTALHAIGSTFTEVLQLALGLSTLATEVLFLAFLAQVLVAKHVTQGLLGGTDGLVPGTGGALLAVLGSCTGVGVCGEGTQLGGGVAGLVFGGGFLPRGFTFGLVVGFVS
jgi:hypothetical protein